MPLTQDQIQNYIKEVGFYDEGDSYRTLCPNCNHPNRKLYINKTTGVYNCFHCSEAIKSMEHTNNNTGHVNGNTMENSPILRKEYIKECVNNLNKTEYRVECLNYLVHKRHLTLETIKEFNFGYDPYEKAITIPSFLSDDDTITSVTYRYLEGDQRYKTTGTKGWFLGERAKSLDCDYCVIFEGELDAITSYQLDPSIPTIATQGKNVCKEELKKYVDKFEKIYICYDEDTDKEVEKLATMLGKQRCWQVNLPDGLDLNELAAYSEALDIYKKCLQEAEPLVPPFVVKIGDKIDECVSYFSDRRYQAYSTGFEALDSVTGGIRPGELYVVTGDSGLGKSTFTVYLGMMLASQGYKTSICSLELPFKSHIGPKIASFTLQRNIEVPTKISNEEYRSCLEGVASSDTLSLVDRVGSLSNEDLINVLDDVYKKGYKCLILDHLQFLVRKEENDEINQVVRILVDFLKIHLDFTIILVAHCRKPLRDFKTGAAKELGMHDLKGSAALYQEPDNVWILNRDSVSDLVSLKVGKLRADKTAITAGGKVMLYFNKNTFTYNVVPSI